MDFPPANLGFSHPCESLIMSEMASDQTAMIWKPIFIYGHIRALKGGCVTLFIEQ